jgi:hypothetical protein
MEYSPSKDRWQFEGIIDAFVSRVRVERSFVFSNFQDLPEVG